MKIIIISDGHLPIPAVLGGAVPTLIDSIIRENENQGYFEITVSSVYNPIANARSKAFKKTKYIYLEPSKYGEFIDKHVQALIEKIIPSRKGRKIRFLWKLKVIKSLRELLSDEDYDAVIIENQGYLMKIFESDKLLKKYEGKIYYHLHNEIPNSASSKVVKRSKLILVSNYLSKMIIEKHGEEIRDNLHVLYNGISVKNANQVLGLIDRDILRKQLGFLEDDRVVCFVGRLCFEKGIHELLHAFKEINDEKIKLLIIGSTEFGNNQTSEFEENIYSICASLGNRVKYTGYIEHENLWRYYQTADLAVLPSVWEEPAGLTILESMLNGLPVITTYSGGIPEYMKTDFGIMLERDEYLSQRIAEAINTMCNDMEKWRECGVKGKNYVIQNFSEKKFYFELCKILGVIRT